VCRLYREAGLADIGAAWFPTECPGQDEIIPGAHVVSSVIMFVMLSLLCRIYYLRARSVHLAGANRRTVLYAVCGFAILGSMGLVVLDHLIGGPLKALVPRLEFYCEQSALIAFAVAWLAASHLFPWITAPQERWMH
jgi:hypothetical protein